MEAALKQYFSPSCPGFESWSMKKKPFKNAKTRKLFLWRAFPLYGRSDGNSSWSRTGYNLI